MKQLPSIIAFFLFCAAVSALASEEKFQDDHRSFFSLLQLDPSDAKFRYYYQPENQEDGGPGEFDLQEFQAKFEVPLPAGEDFYFRFGMDYGARLFDFQEVQGAGTSESSETLHKAVGSIGAGIFFSENFLLTGAVRLGLYSDFDETPDDDDFDTQGDAIVVYRINPGTQLIAGAARSKAFEDYDVYPLIGFRVRGEDGALHVGLTFPQELRVGYNFSEDFQLYGGVWITGDEYRAGLGGRGDRFNVRIQDRRCGGGVLYWFDDHFNVLFEGGLTLGGEFEFKTENAGQFSDDVDPAGYFSAGVGAAF
jgi:hypothetical protein